MPVDISARQQQQVDAGRHVHRSAVTTPQTPSPSTTKQKAFCKCRCSGAFSPASRHGVSGPSGVTEESSICYELEINLMLALNVVACWYCGVLVCLTLSTTT